jgi:transposase
VKDPRTAALRTWADAIARRRGKKIAMVALARRLARLLFAMWRDEVAYDPARIRSSPRTSVAASDDGVTRAAVHG